MKEKLIAVLEQFCKDNVYLQGTIEEDAVYPLSFITFWTDYTDDEAFYDNDAHSSVWHYNVIFYSSDQNLVDTKPAEIRAALKAAGFIPQSRGRDIPSDVESHTGWAMDFIYKQYTKE